jgi:AraC-like DNA-binding protein
MDFLYRPPRIGLEEFINGFVNLEGSADHTSTIPLYPNNCSYLTFSYLNSATFLSQNDKYQLPKLFVSGQVMENNLRLVVNESIGHLGIEFKPTAFYKLFQFDMSSILNTYIPLSEIDRNHATLLQKLEDVEDFQNRCNILEDYLLDKIKGAVKTDRIDHCIKLLEENPATMVKELCRIVAIGERQLRRDFLRKVGVSPKVYAKIQQIKQVFLMIDQDQKESLKEYAYSCGYYDVAHFIHAFQSDIGQNPSKFIDSYDDYLSFYLSNRR